MPAKKAIRLNASGLREEFQGTVSSTGSANDGDFVSLDSNGKLDSTLMPVGIGASTSNIIASENLAAGALINIHNNTGTPNVRNADASASNQSRAVDGFVLTAVTSGQSATVYTDNGVPLTGLSGLTPGTVYFLSGSTPGSVTTSRPTTTGHTLQRVGKAINATSLKFEPDVPITLA